MESKVPSSYAILTVIIINFSREPLETKVFKGKPYSKIPKIVIYYEASIGQVGMPRWIVASPSVVNDVERGLRNAGAVKQGEYFRAEVGTIYDRNNVLNSNMATIGIPLVQNEGQAPAVANLTELVGNGRDEIPAEGDLSAGYQTKPTDGIVSETTRMKGEKLAVDPLAKLIQGFIAQETEAESRIKQLRKQIWD